MQMRLQILPMFYDRLSVLLSDYSYSQAYPKLNYAYATLVQYSQDWGPQLAYRLCK